MPDIIEEGEIIGRNRQDILQDIERLDGETDKYTEELSEMDNLQGDYYDKALAELTDYLDDKSIRALRRKALETSSKKDDQLVDSIEQRNGMISERERLVKELKKERREAARVVADLESVERKFVRNDYESSRSYFPSSFDVDDFVLGYLAGTTSISDVERSIDRSQNFKPKPRRRSSSYSSSSSSSSSWSSGGGFGGGGFSSGGGF